MAPPATAITAGTSNSRTTVASSRIAKARPKPNCLSSRTRAKSRLPKTITMMAAAVVICTAVRARPAGTASRSLPVRSRSSMIRLTRKIS